VGLDAEQAEAVALLALVAGQDVEPGDRPSSWRIARKVANDRVISTVDPQARHGRKTSAHKLDGYKARIAAEPETGLVTECALTAASTPDGPTGVGLLAGEEPGLEVLADSAYGGGATRAALRAAGHTQTIKPLPLHSAVPGGFTSTTSASTSRPASSGAQRATPRRSAARAGPASPATAPAARCAGAAHRHRWPQHPLASPRRRAACRPPPRDQAQLPAQLSALAADGGTLAAWLVADGCRRVPYRGIGRNDLWWSLRVAAVNLRRLLVLGLTRQDQAWALA